MYTKKLSSNINVYFQNRYNNQAEPDGTVVVEDEYEDEDDEEEEERISVPLTITMTVIGGYVFMGALLFGVWEGWDALQV